MKKTGIQKTNLVRGRREAHKDKVQASHGSVKRKEGDGGAGKEITELRLALETLRDSEKKYRLLHESMMDGFVRVEMDGRIIEFNDIYKNMLGYTDAELYRLSYIDLTPEKWHAYEAEIVENQIIKRGYSDVYEKEYRRKDGTIFPIELHSVLIRDDKGKPVGIWGIARDITERKKAEEAMAEKLLTKRSLVESEARYSTFLNAFTDCAFLKDDQLRYILVNEANARFFGKPVADIIGRNDFDLMDKDLARACRASDEQALRENGLVTTTEESNGRFYETHKFPVQLQGGRIGVGGYVRDISEKLQAEQVLTESEARYRGLFEDSPISIWEEDFSSVKEGLGKLRREGVVDFRAYLESHPKALTELLSGIKIIDANKASVKMMHARDKQQLVQSFKRVTGKARSAGFIDEFARIADGETDFEWEGVNYTLTGETLRVSLHWSVVPGYEETLGRVLVSLLDITERKEAEEALRESEFFFKESQRAANVGSYKTDFTTGFWESSEVLDQIFGIGKDYVRSVAGWLEIIHPDDRQMMDRYLQEEVITRRIPFNKEYRIVRKSDGETRWVYGLGRVSFDAEGHILSMIGTIQDITSRKEAEEAHRLSEERFRGVFENVSIGIYRTAPDGHILLANPAICRMLGYDSFEELARQNLEQDGFQPEYSRSQFRELIERQGAVIGLETFWKTKDGGTKYVRESAMAFRDQGGNILYYEGTAEDVTDRKVAEKTLAVQTEELRHQNEALTRLNDQAEQRMQRLVSMRTIDMAISGSFDVGIVLGIVLDQVTGQLGTHAADILLFNPNGQTFKFSSGRGFRTLGLERSQYTFGGDLVWRIIRERREVEIKDLKAQPNVLQRTPDLSGEGFVSYIGVPLISKGQIQGVMEVFEREPLDRDQEWHNYLDTLAGQAAIAIDNAQLFDHLQSTNTDLVMAYDNTLAGWASALELRDKETEGHTRRVANLALQLAHAMSLDEEEQVRIFRGALLHDIGKMGLPDSIVLKPGPLTDDEWVLMRRHPQYAYDMLSSIAYLRPSLDIPHCHHEKWDGTGYPRGLKGDNIPMAARLFAVIDVWDALTSDRPYRKAWSEEQALDYIRQQSGRHFDPTVVKTFLETAQRWKKVG